MIITKLKDIDEIYEMIKPYSKILIAGCDGCCQPPRSINEAKVLGQMLELKSKMNGKNLTWKAITVLRQCDDRIAGTTVRPYIDEYEAIVSLACGLGVSMLSRIFEDTLTFPAQDSMFGASENHGDNLYEQYCDTCGECLLGETAGICPVASCAKGLHNGPCGGQVDGFCEVGGYKYPCAWIQIYERLKKFNRLDLFNKFRPPKDYRLMTSPGHYELIQEYTNAIEEEEVEK